MVPEAPERHKHDAHACGLNCQSTARLPCAPVLKAVLVPKTLFVY